MDLILIRPVVFAVAVPMRLAANSSKDAAALSTELLGINLVPGSISSSALQTAFCFASRNSATAVIGARMEPVHADSNKGVSAGCC